MRAYNTNKYLIIVIKMVKHEKPSFLHNKSPATPYKSLRRETAVFSSPLNQEDLSTAQYQPSRRPT